MRHTRLPLVLLGLLAIGVVSAGCGNLIGVGGGVSCVVQSDGAPNCFGANGSGQAGHAAGVTPASPGAVALPKGYGTIDISAGEGAANGLATVCAVAGRANAQSGFVYCWGDDTGGLLGRGSAGAASATPVKVPLGTDNGAQAVSVGGTLACAIVSGVDSGVLCWGAWPGPGITGPAVVSGTANLRAADGSTSAASLLAVGQSHACAGISTKLVCWGTGTAGQLGNAASADSASPVKVALPKTIDSVGELAAGDGSTCVVATDKRGAQAVWCWGALVASNVPVRVPLPDGLDASHVSVGFDHACAVASDQSVWCFGANGSGQLGDGTQTASATPVRAGAFKATLVGAGQGQSCASDTGGHLRCWGDNAQEQLGVAAIAFSAVPVTVPGIDGLRAPKPKLAKIAVAGSRPRPELTATTAPWPYVERYTYQWQYRTSQGEWTDWPNATGKTLRPRHEITVPVRVSITGTNAWTEAGVVMSETRTSLPIRPR